MLLEVCHATWRCLDCRWPAILGIVLGGLLVLSLCGGIFARKRTRRIYGVRPPGHCNIPTLDLRLPDWITFMHGFWIWARI